MADRLERACRLDQVWGREEPGCWRLRGRRPCRILAVARVVARRVALQHPDRLASADDVFEVLMDWGHEPSVLGRAAGSLFLLPDWESTPLRTPSRRLTNHRREIQLWRYRGPACAGGEPPWATPACAAGHGPGHAAGRAAGSAGVQAPWLVPGWLDARGAPAARAAASRIARREIAMPKGANPSGGDGPRGGVGGRRRCRPCRALRALPRVTVVERVPHPGPGCPGRPERRGASSAEGPRARCTRAERSQAERSPRARGFTARPARAGCAARRPRPPRKGDGQ